MGIEPTSEDWGACYSQSAYFVILFCGSRHTNISGTAAYPSGKLELNEGAQAAFGLGGKNNSQYTYTHVKRFSATIIAGE